MQRLSNVQTPCRAVPPVLLLAALMLSLELFGTNAIAQCQYRISAFIQAPVDCDILGPPITRPAAINDHGVVTGYYHCIAGLPRPFMWSEEMGFVAIPLPPGISEATPLDINNNNEIVGRANDHAAGGSRGFLYSAGEWTWLTPLSGDFDDYSVAHAINDAGEVMGMRGLIAFHWRDGVFTDLNAPRGAIAVPRDINSNGQATGDLQLGGFSSHVFTWEGDRVIDLGAVFSGFRAIGWAIDESGRIVGSASVNPNEPFETHAFLFDGRDFIDLGVPLPYVRADARDINEAGQVIVNADDFMGMFTSGSSFVWQNGVFTDLNNDLSPEEGSELFVQGVAINEVGQIAAVAQGLPEVHTLVAVLSPVDRPLGDVNIDCRVDELDLVAVLEDWGPGKPGHPADIVANTTFAPPSDGRVDGADLAVVLGNWSPTPQSPRKSR